MVYQFEQGPAVFLFAGGTGGICPIGWKKRKQIDEKGAQARTTAFKHINHIGRKEQQRNSVIVESTK